MPALPDIFKAGSKIRDSGPANLNSPPPTPLSARSRTPLLVKEGPGVVGMNLRGLFCLVARGPEHFRVSCKPAKQPHQVGPVHTLAQELIAQ